jgi:Tol biopolymer transport system component
MKRVARQWVGCGFVGAILTLGGCVSGTGLSSSAELCSGSSPTPIVDPAARPLAFTSDRSGGYDLWLMSATGSDAAQLTTSPGAEGLPSWSPDGSRLAFMAAADLEGAGDICVVNADGTNLHNLTRTAGVTETSPAWSPDGTQIAYGTWEGNRQEIHVMDSTGRESRLITDNGTWPSWSPDGDRLVFNASRGGAGQDPWTTPQDLWTIAVDGSDRTLLAKEPSGLTEPAWSPDGLEVAFVSASGDAQASDPTKWDENIFVMSAAGGVAHRVTSLPGNDHWPPAWSPDSARLAFTADGEDNVGEIFVVDLDSLRTTNLTDHSAHDAFPAWRR